MPRPNRDRVTVTAYISRGGRDLLDELAERYGTTRSDLIREALKAGLPQVERALRRGSMTQA